MRPIPVVLLGASIGGLKALCTLLATLPTDFAAALVIVIHRASEESGDLLPVLAAACALPVGFPLDKDPILAGRIYVAPPNYHMLLEGDHFAYSLDAPENFARPSIDVLFESVAEGCAAGITAVLLTGSGEDGARGLAAIHCCGGEVLVQTPSDASAPQMPLAALAITPQARQLTLQEIATWLARMRSAKGEIHD